MAFQHSDFNQSQDTDKDALEQKCNLDPVLSAVLELSLHDYNNDHPQHPMDDTKLKPFFVRNGLNCKNITARFTVKNFTEAAKQAEIPPCFALRIWKHINILKQPKTSVCGKYNYISKNDQQAHMSIAVIEMWEEKCRKQAQIIGWLSNKLHKELSAKSNKLQNEF
eukprot:180503_1